VEIGTEAAQYPEKEYINGIFRIFIVLHTAPNIFMPFFQMHLICWRFMSV
jgi:hypothetical protein